MRRALAIAFAAVLAMAGCGGNESPQAPDQLPPRQHQAAVPDGFGVGGIDFVSRLANPIVSTVASPGVADRERLKRPSHVLDMPLPARRVHEERLHAREQVLKPRAMEAQILGFGGAQLSAAGARVYGTVTVFDVPFLQTILVPLFVFRFFFAASA